MTDGTILHALFVRQLMSVQTLGSTAVRGPWQVEIIQYLKSARILHVPAFYLLSM